MHVCLGDHVCVFVAVVVRRDREAVRKKEDSFRSNFMQIAATELAVSCLLCVHKTIRIHSI